MNILHRCFLAILLVATGVFTSTAQYTEVGAFLSASNYIGDLQQQLESSEYNPGIGLQVRFVRSKRLSLQGHFYKLRISGKDENSLSELRQARNLSVRTDIYELGFQAEFNLSPYEIKAGKISAPYIFAGVSGMYFNPQASYMGTWRDLQPLGTEGQTLNGNDDKYSVFAPAIPFGIGFRFNLFERINLNLEMGMRYTFTDYLDDISGLYPDIVKLTAQDPIAGALSYRSPEYAGEPLSNPVGLARGDNYKHDLVFVAGLGITFNLASGYDLELDPKYIAFRDFQPIREINTPVVDTFVNEQAIDIIDDKPIPASDNNDKGLIPVEEDSRELPPVAEDPKPEPEILPVQPGTVEESTDSTIQVPAENNNKEIEIPKDDG